MELSMLERQAFHRSRAMELLVIVITIASVSHSILSYGAISDSVAGQKTIARFIVNFAKFVQWPDSVFADSGGQYKVCIYGDVALEPEFAKFIGSKKVNKRGFSVVAMDAIDIEALRPCHIVYFTPKGAGKIAEISDLLTGVPVLTVSDADGFAKAGGMIGFVGNHRRVRMQINKTRITNANLKASEQLLRIGS